MAYNNVVIAAGDGVVACPSKKSVNFTVTTYGRVPSKFIDAGSSTLTTTEFYKATISAHGLRYLTCTYKTNNRGIYGRLMSKKKACLHYGSGWNAKGTTCTASIGANCRAICPG